MDNPALAWPRVGLLPVVHAIEAALRERRGFSLIRLGDGEGAVLAQADPAWHAEVDFSRAIWFGDQDISEDDFSVIRQGLERAVAQADVVGLPRPRQVALSRRYGVVFEHVAHALLMRSRPQPPLLGDAALHFYLQWSGLLGAILRQARRLTLITCRDVGGELAAHFDVPVRIWPVRGEALYPGSETMPHWPDGFSTIMERLDVDIVPGDLVLVGAGVLGKLYCEQARLRNGVALDLGSVFDGWQGLLTRGERIARKPEFMIPWLARGEKAAGDALQELQRYMLSTNIPDANI